MGFKSICYSTSLLEWHCSAEFKPKKRKKRFQAKSFAQTEFSGNILGLSKKSESFRSLINLALVQVLERECCAGCSLRSWRYCLGARLQFWRRSQNLKKGVGTRCLVLTISRSLHRSWRLRYQISHDYYTIPPATQATQAVKT